MDQCQNIFHVDTFGNDKVQIGCLAIDTAATRTIMQTKTNLLAKYASKNQRMETVGCK